MRDKNRGVTVRTRTIIGSRFTMYSTCSRCLISFLQCLINKISLASAVIKTCDVRACEETIFLNKQRCEQKRVEVFQLNFWLFRRGGVIIRWQIRRQIAFGLEDRDRSFDE